MSIKELGIHGINIKGTTVYVESDKVARKIREAVRKEQETNPNVSFKTLTEVANGILNDGKAKVYSVIEEVSENVNWYKHSYLGFPKAI